MTQYPLKISINHLSDKNFVSKNITNYIIDNSVGNFSSLVDSFISSMVNSKQFKQIDSKYCSFSFKIQTLFTNLFDILLNKRFKKKDKYLILKR